MVEIARCGPGVGPAWAQKGMKRRQLGTGCSLTQGSGLPRPLVHSTNRRDFDPMVRPRGTAPNGHFDALLKTARHGTGTKRAQAAHQNKTPPVWAASADS